MTGYAGLHRYWQALMETGCLALLMAIHATAAAAERDSVPVQKLEPIYQYEAANGTDHLCTREQAALRSPNPPTAAFLAVTSMEWPECLTPLFGVELDGQFELRRRPREGQGNFTDPLFFALPPETEAGSMKIAGRWECVATRADGSKNHLAMELAVEGELLAGRFDQNTDYRIAHISGGRFYSNRIELNVEYVMDRYALVGAEHDGRLTGVWKRSDDGDHGAWTATRPTPSVRLELPSGAVPLYEWRRTSNGARRYSIQAELGEPGWERAPRPLCRVWRRGSIESRPPKRQ